MIDATTEYLLYWEVGGLSQLCRVSVSDSANLLPIYRALQVQYDVSVYVVRLSEVDAVALKRAAGFSEGKGNYAQLSF